MKGIFENLIVPKRILSEVSSERDAKPYRRLPDTVADSIIEQQIDISELTRNLVWIPETERGEVVRAFARLLLELRYDIDAYDTIIGDDTSARVLTRFFDYLLDDRRKKSGKEEAETFYLSGGREPLPEKVDAIETFIEERKHTLGRVLLVTEYINKGDGFKWLAEIFQSAGVSFDIAALSVVNPDVLPDLPVWKGLRYGSVGDVGIVFHDELGSGVEKNFSAPGFLAHSSATHEFNELVRDSRADMRYLSLELATLLDVET